MHNKMLINNDKSDAQYLVIANMCCDFIFIHISFIPHRGGIIVCSYRRGNKDLVGLSNFLKVTQTEHSGAGEHRQADCHAPL